MKGEFAPLVWGGSAQGFLSESRPGFRLGDRARNCNILPHSCCGIWRNNTRWMSTEWARYKHTPLRALPLYPSRTRWRRFSRLCWRIFCSLLWCAGWARASSDHSCVCVCVLPARSCVCVFAGEDCLSAPVGWLSSVGVHDFSGRGLSERHHASDVSTNRCALPWVKIWKHFINPLPSADQPYSSLIQCFTHTHTHTHTLQAGYTCDWYSIIITTVIGP